MISAYNLNKIPRFAELPQFGIKTLKICKLFKHSTGYCNLSISQCAVCRKYFILIKMVVLFAKRKAVRSARFTLMKFQKQISNYRH